MTQKNLLFTIALIALLVTAGAFWCMERRQVVVNPPVVTDLVVELGQESASSSESFYSQHIETIPGNTDEVWYNIPEYGVRMRLNKNFAEDLIYSDGMIDDFGKEQTGIYFSTKAIAEVAPECAPRRGGAFGVMFKQKGNAKEDAKTDEFLGARVDDYLQIGDYYYGWVSPQALCEFPIHQGVVQKNWPKEYLGIGAKNMFDGSKTLELIQKK